MTNMKLNDTDADLYIDGLYQLYHYYELSFKKL